MHGEDRDFIYEDEVEFGKKYRNRRKNTEKWFNEFAETMRDYFAGSSVKDLPYTLRLDSDDLYQPTAQEQRTFFKWLENEIQAINRGKPSWHWVVEKAYYGPAASYSTFYRIHKPTHQNDVKAEYQLTVTGPFELASLELSIHSYGALNLDPITSNVESGLKQLESSASRETDKQIPRIIALAFESGIGFEWRNLLSHVAWLLKEHPSLSAIAVLDWIPDGIPPPQEDGMESWYQFYLTTPTVPRFIVFHNSWLQTAKPLPTSVFSDKWSTQLSPVKYQVGQYK